MAQATGFQDYNRLSIQAGQVLYQATSALGTFPASGRLDAGGFGYVNISLSGGVGTATVYRLSVVWFADAAMTQLIATENITLIGTPQQFQVTAVGRWFTVFPAFESGSNTDVLTVIALGSNVYSPRMPSQLNSVPYIYANQVFGAMTIVDFAAQATVPGLATWSVRADTNNQWLSSLAYYDIGSGTYQEFAFMYGAARGQAGIDQVNLPFAPIRLRLDNMSAVNQTFQGSLIGSAF